MSRIGIEETKRLAELAKIGLTDEEAAQMSVELDKIVEFVEQLSKVDVDKVEPTDQVTGLSDVFREDTIKKSPTRETMLANAPAQQDGYIKVRRVLG